MGLHVARMFYRHGLLIADHPKLFIILPLALTAALALGLFNFRVENDIRFLYSPENARSRQEYAIHQNFSGEGVLQTYCALAIERSPLIEDRNLINEESAYAILDINRYVLNNLTLWLGDRRFSYGREVCPKLPFCLKANAIVEEFFRVKASERLQQEKQIRIVYPNFYFYDHVFFLPAHLYGVETNEYRDVTEVEMVNMIFPIPSVGGYTADDVALAFEESLRDYLAWRGQRAQHDPLLPSLFSLRMLRDEVNKNTHYTYPYISLTVVLIVGFTFVSCLTGDWLTSKSMEGLYGVTSSSMAIVSAAGLLFLCDIPFISQAAVMPFIALAIGVDDTYIILGAWQRTKRGLPAKERLAQSMSDAGIAITVTTATDCMSFAIGAFSATPAISIFCKFIAAAILFDYLYQVTFFPAIVYYAGVREGRGYHSIFFWRKVDEKTVNRISASDYECPIAHFVNTKFTPFLLHPITEIGIVFVYLTYISLAIYGCCTLTPNLRPSSLMVDDSPLRHYLDLAQTHIWAEGLTGRVYVNNAPDFAANETVVEDFLRFVGEIEKLEFSLKSESTSLWLRSFLYYWSLFKHEHKDFYKALRSFLENENNQRWAMFLQWVPDPERCTSRCITKFYFTTGFQINDWNDRTAMMLEWRRVVDEFPMYDALVFDEQNFYSDQTLSLPHTTLQSLGIALLAMAVVCLVFITERLVVFWVCFTLLSMDIGIIGFLALWGAELSPTTVVNILMSIGLSIDFSTHVGYRIYRSPIPASRPLDRVREALGAIAWPVAQGGVSTFLAIISMLCVPSHVVRMFAKTTILVVTFGFLHGLVLLPVVLRSMVIASPLRPVGKKQQQQQQQQQQQRHSLALPLQIPYYNAQTQFGRKS